MMVASHLRLSPDGHSCFSRHLLRFWLRNEELAWTLPESLKPLWRKTFNVNPQEQTFAIEPVIRDAVMGKK